MKKLFFALFAAGITLSMQAQVRNEIHVPDLGGYETLKCDFHMHTVYSDGLVWPTVRVDEAWREGLDAISLTEHLEYRPHQKDVTGHHGRSFEVAEGSAKGHDILLIRGSEITRSMAPGHFNAVFLNDCNALDQDDWHDSFKAAKDQHAFIFWNHPGWDRQQPDTTLWWKEHTEIYEKGWMQGIEVANGKFYYPEAHRWCLEKGLTMLGNSDVHNPINLDIEFYKGEHRTMTFVLADERTVDGIREALDNRRTIVWVNDLLIGEEHWLKELFEKSVKIIDIKRGKKSCRLVLQNESDLTFSGAQLRFIIPKPSKGRAGLISVSPTCWYNLIKVWITVFLFNGHIKIAVKSHFFLGSYVFSRIVLSSTSFKNPQTIISHPVQRLALPNLPESFSIGSGIWE